MKTYQKKTCQAPDCKKLQSSRNSVYCTMHGLRLKKTGKLEPERKLRGTGIHDIGKGYIEVRCKGHPLNKGTKRIYHYEHRVVFYNAHGMGPFKCHRCDEPVTWDTVNIVHLNDIKTDNRLDNLAPSCARCRYQTRNRDNTTPVSKPVRLVQRHSHKGESLTLPQWAERYDVIDAWLYWQTYQGRTISEALDHLEDLRKQGKGPSKPSERSKEPPHTEHPKGDQGS